MHCVLSLHRYGQYIQTYRTHGYFNGNPFSDRCHTHVPDFIDGYAGCAVYQTEIFNGTSNDHPHFAMESYIGVFPYRSFAYMGISVLIYLTYMAILWYYNNKSPIRQESKNMAIKLKRHKGLTIKEKSHSSAESRL